jgi:hypothetical protein
MHGFSKSSKAPEHLTGEDIYDLKLIYACLVLLLACFKRLLNNLLLNSWSTFSLGVVHLESLNNFLDYYTNS